MSKRRLTDEQIERAAAMRERGLSFGQIAQRLGVSPGAVSWHCLRLGAERPNAGPLRAPPNEPVVFKRGAHEIRPFTAVEDAQLLELASKGLSRAAIGRALGRKHNSVMGRLMTLARHEVRGIVAKGRSSP